MKNYKITKVLAKKLLDLLSEDFDDQHFLSFLRGFFDDSSSFSSLKPQIREERKASKGHISLLKLYSELRPHNKIHSNQYVKIQVEGQEKNLEFDIVDYTSYIIFEVQGIQHQEYNTFFHQSREDFLAQQARDNAKVYWAKQSGWTIICLTDKEAKTITKEELLQKIISALG